MPRTGRSKPPTDFRGLPPVFERSHRSSEAFDGFFEAYDPFLEAFDRFSEAYDPFLEVFDRFSTGSHRAFPAPSASRRSSTTAAEPPERSATPNAPQALHAKIVPYRPSPSRLVNQLPFTVARGVSFEVTRGNEGGSDR
ncbi:hypothetical protein [Sorangium sp. So ce381]|uniref:hypothetical protein n=1 Tax=Sorangium sp. So ce381 TaxID=3133307 RepID=UPI003F5BAF63